MITVLRAIVPLILCGSAGVELVVEPQVDVVEQVEQQRVAGLRKPGRIGGVRRGQLAHVREVAELAEGTGRGCLAVGRYGEADDGEEQPERQDRGQRSQRARQVDSLQHEVAGRDGLHGGTSARWAGGIDGRWFGVGGMASASRSPAPLGLTAEDEDQYGRRRRPARRGRVGQPADPAADARQVEPELPDDRARRDGPGIGEIVVVAPEGVLAVVDGEHAMQHRPVEDRAVVEHGVTDAVRVRVCTTARLPVWRRGSMLMPSVTA